MQRNEQLISNHSRELDDYHERLDWVENANLDPSTMTPEQKAAYKTFEKRSRHHRNAMNRLVENGTRANQKTVHNAFVGKNKAIDKLKDTMENS